MGSVLVVDDDAGVRDTLVAGLVLHGLQASAVSNGLEALSALVTFPSDAYVVDLRLPDMTGLALVRAMRLKGVTHPIVILTGFGTCETALEAGRLGVVAFVEKPACIDTIVPLISGLIESSRDLSAVDPAVAKWCGLVLSGLLAERDVRTLEGWAELVAHSRPSLVRRCAAVGVAPKACLDLVRVLRAVRLANALAEQPGSFLDSDPRTCQRLLSQAQPGRSDAATVWCMTETLERQSFVRSRVLISALKRLVRVSPGGQTA